VLEVVGSLDVTGASALRGDTHVYGAVAADGAVTGSNLVINENFPTSAAEGTILVRAGLVYFRRAGLWEQALSTGTGGDQTGDIKQSMRTPVQMPGWLRMLGQTLQESEASYTQLFSVGGLTDFITGEAPNRLMTLPDATERFLMTGHVPGAVGGTKFIDVTEENMPTHSHGVSMSPAGVHDHTVTLDHSGGHQHRTVAGDGRHIHSASDQGHSHEGVDGWGGQTGNNFVGLAWGGNNKTDGPINDASHTYSVEAFPRTARATSNIVVGMTSSEHTHLTEMAPDHFHFAYVSPSDSHAHVLAERIVGGGQPINVQPRYLTVYTYIKL
jgi:microcystin-dependent protein